MNRASPARLYSRYIICALMIVIAGCRTGRVDRLHEADRLLSAYQLQSQAALVHHDSLQRSQIERLNVSGAGASALVSVILKDAPLAAVINRLLHDAGQPFVLQDVALRGRATATFENIALLPALNLLLRGGGYSASMENGVAAIRYGGELTGSGTDDMVMHVEVPLNYVTGERVPEMLNSLLNGRDLRYAYIQHTGNVVLTGKRSQVEEAIALLRSADREPQHVLIEALVVEIDREGLQRLGIDIARAASGNFSEIFATFGDVRGSALSFTHRAGADNPKEFSMFIDALAVTDVAEVLARPYLSTRSGQEALVEITQDRTFLVQQLQQGTVATGEHAISRAGVMMKVTPWVLPGQEIRLSIDVTESQFIPTSGNIAAEIDQNHAVTTMQVPSGQTIIIGGLALKRESSSNAGVPILRSIPIIKLLFSRRDTAIRNQEVIIFITPHIWNPSMVPPLVEPGIIKPRRIDGGR